MRLSLMASRALLRHVASECGVSLPATIPRRCPACGSRTHGPPALGRGLHASLTRRSTLVAVAVAAHPVGIDLEERDVLVPDSPLVFSEEERRWLETASRSDSVWVWTAKEAVGKLTGHGLIGSDSAQVPRRPGGSWMGAVDGQGTAAFVLKVPVRSRHVVALASRECATVEIVPAGRSGVGRTPVQNRRIAS
jgi:phosphopantetheinyl transferase